MEKGIRKELRNKEIRGNKGVNRLNGHYYVEKKRCAALKLWKQLVEIAWKKAVVFSIVISGGESV